MTRREVLIALGALCLFMAALPAEAGKASKSAGKRAWRRLFARDAARDAATPTKPVPKPTNVWRYTSKEEAEAATRQGLAPNKHMTSKTTPGRPPAAKTAKERYGLAREPEVRMKIEVPQGQPVRRNKVLGGAPGVGEMTSPKPVPPEAIKGVTPLE